MYRPTIIDKQLSKLDNDIAQTLNSDLPDDEKAKRYEMILRGYRYYEHKVSQQKTTQQIEKENEDDQILESTPSHLRPKAKQLLKRIKGHTKWTDDGEIQTDDLRDIVPHSNIGELVATAVDRSKIKKKHPTGFSHFAAALKRADMPKELIPNDDVWNRMNPRRRKRRSRSILPWDIDDAE